jgi:hypothetical protein
MSRLTGTANDPERLYFTQVDDETPMEIPGLNPDFKMNGYKFADIRKVARNFSGINGYGVGLGKTSFALAAVQHIQNIGVKNKTMFVVPNSVLSNWRKEASMVLTDTSDCLYVGLEITKDGDAKVKSKNYDTDLMRILENRHKKIFVTMEAFARLRLRQETAESYDAYLASVDQSYAASDDKKKDVQAEGKRAKLIHGLVNSKSKSAAAPFFEDLGIDSIVIDEAHCFPAGTMVDGRPIETIKVGDFVNSFNHGTGLIEMRKVTAVMRRAPSGLVRVNFHGGASVVSTHDHPFFVPGSGYVEAQFLYDGCEVLSKDTKTHHEYINKALDFLKMQSVRDGFHAEACANLEAGHRQSDSVLLQQIMRNDMEASKQSAAEGCTQGSRDEGEAEGCTQVQRELATDARGGGEESSKANRIWNSSWKKNQEPRGEWPRIDDTSEDASGSSAVADGICAENRCDEGQRNAIPLQARSGESSLADCDRGGWQIASALQGESIGSKEGRILEVTRVESVEVLESAGDRRFGGVCPDGYVYDITVDGNHNFFAEGILVHNCYKNSSEANDFEGGRYLSLAKSSDRGDDAQAKTWFVRKQSGERGDGVLCLTATAITNSPLEIYSMLSLSTGHKRLNDMMMGIKGADQFMETMCVMEGKQETAIDGTEKDYNVFTGLTNVSVLRGAISQVCVIKNAKDVGAMIKLPEADETPVSVALPDDIVSDLIDYQQAFRFAIDTLKEKDKVGGDSAAFDRVAAKFGEPMELIGHPFNLINKMAALILDKELDDRGTFYTFDDAARAKAEKVVADYNAKAPVEDRSREGPQTRPDAVVGTKTKKDGDKKTTILQIKALARIEGNRIIIDTITPETQTKFEDLADKAGLDLDVTVPPKLAALIDNFQKEEATPRGIGDDGAPTARVKQIIFCDALPLHNKIKRLLSKRCGVAAGSIAIITGKINGKPEEIMDVQDGFNADGEDNKYRVVIANEKAEVGINLQKGTQAIHHLTIGWTPDSLTQRNGRGVRQGNKTDRVTVYQYDADGTFDSYKRKLVSKKADWIDNVMSKDGGDHVTVEGGLSDEAQEALIDSIGDANGMSKIQERMAAADRAARAATNQAKQVINLQTAMAQTTFLAKYAKPTAWAADKMVAYVAVLDQISAIKDRLRNPKLQANTIIRMEALQADLTARSNGMRAELVDSLEVFETTGYGKDRAAKGDPVSLEAMIADATRYIGRGDTKESKIRDWFEQSYGMLKTVKVGSTIENEWQSEVDMAKAMIEESKKDFVAMADRHGAYSAEILKRIDSGEAALIDGKVICKGAFVRDKKGSLTLIYQTNGRFYARNGINFASVNAVDVMRGGEVVLPGAEGYDECLDEAAKLDDAYLAKLTSVKPDSKNNLLGTILPEIAQRWKGVFDVTYEARRYLLPHPHFPIVITPAQAELGDVLAAIHKSQKGVVKSITEGYFPEFTVAGDVAVTSDRNTISETAFIDYAKAHGLKISRGELGTMGITKVADMMEEGMLETFQAEVIDGALSEDALIANLDAWLKKALAIFKLETAPQYMLSPVDFLDNMLTQRGIFNARRASLNMGKTPEQAEQAAELDPSRMVGINGDTKTWKDQIKSCASMAGGRAIWDGTAGCWNVTFKAWQRLITIYPDAEKALSVVESSGKTSYGRRRR